MQIVTALVDFSEPLAPRSLRAYTNPIEVLVADRIDEVVPVLERVWEAALNGLHAVGFVAYEAAPALDGRMTVPPRSPIPLAWFAITRAPVLQPESQATPPVVRSRFDLQPWDASPDRANHGTAIDDIEAAIARGDVYQVNHTVRIP